MKGKVIERFQDKYNSAIFYEVGTIVDFEANRMADLVARNLCEKIEGQEETPAPKVNNKESKKAPRKKVLDGGEVAEPKEKTTEENIDDELEEKTKSEQEAAKKIAEATKRANKK